MAPKKRKQLAAQESDGEDIQEMSDGNVADPEEEDILYAQEEEEEKEHGGFIASGEEEDGADDFSHAALDRQREEAKERLKFPAFSQKHNTSKSKQGKFVDENEDEKFYEMQSGASQRRSTSSSSSSSYHDHVTITETPAALELKERFTAAQALETRTLATFEDYFIWNEPEQPWKNFVKEDYDALLAEFSERFNSIREPIPGTNDLNIDKRIMDFYNVKWEEIDTQTLHHIMVKMKPRYHLGLMLFSVHYKHLTKINENTEEGLKFKSEIQTLQSLIEITMNQLLCIVKLKLHKEGNFDPPEIYQIDQSDISELSRTHQAVLFIAEKLREEKYKRYKQNCYTQVILHIYRTDDGDHFYTEEKIEDRETAYKYRHVFTVETKSWKLHQSIQEMIYKILSKDVSYKAWCTADPSSYKSLTEYFKYSEDFPEIVPLREVRSFQNGLLELNFSKVQYTSFFRDTLHIPAKTIACKHFNMEFNIEHLNVNHWSHIPTPAFEKILNDQKFPAHVKSIVYYMFGRVLYKLNQHDRSETILMGIGKAGVGKTSIGTVAKNFFPDEEVAVLSSNIEEIFGLGPVFVKMFFLCNEVTRNWKLNKGDTKSVITGDDISLAEKHKDARTVKWDKPGMIFGNEPGSWIEMCGAIARRVLYLFFKYKIKPDPEMDKKLAAEVGAMIYKCQRAYENFCLNSQHKEFWEIIPSYFRTLRKKYADELNPVRAFLHTSEEVALSRLKPDNIHYGDQPEFDTRGTTFLARFRIYYQQAGYDMKTIPKRTEIEETLQDEGIKIITTSTMSFYRGVKLLASTSESTPVGLFEHESKSDDAALMQKGGEYYEHIRKVQPAKSHFTAYQTLQQVEIDNFDELSI